MDLSQYEFEKKQEIFNCETHGEMQIEVWRTGRNDDYRGRECPKCKSKKEERQKLEEQERQNQVMKRVREINIKKFNENSGIALRYTDKDLINYITKTEQEMKALKVCNDYVNNFEDHLIKGRCLIFCGNAGTGKTHLACAIVSEVINTYAKQAVYTTIGKIFRAVKSTYSKSSTKSEEEVLLEFTRPSLLVIDEIGVQYGSDTEKNILFEVVNDRYEKLKPTIIISNLSLSSLTEFAGERVVDRLKENGGKLIIFDWKSNRGAS